MKTVKEPIHIDHLVQSKPWSDEELAEFSEVIRKRKEDMKKKSQKDPTKEEENGPIES